MTEKSKARVSARASRNSLDGFRKNFSPEALQVQFLLAAHNVRPVVAAMLAAAVFGGGACDG